LAQIETLNSPKHWIYEGSKILSKRHKTLALAIGIGYTTRRGQIIRKILKRIPSKLEMTQTLTYFFFEITVIVLAITFAFYNFQFGNGIGTA
jgi:magnesium-transporting ATPase (P-type)